MGLLPKVPPVDREAESNLLLQMVRQQVADRILLVEAPAGMGKSWLIQILEERCAAIAECGRIQFNSADVPIAVMIRLRDMLSGVIFARFEAALKRQQASGSASVSNNFQIALFRGSAHIGAMVNNANEEKREISELTSAFCKDLEYAGHVVMFFDKFEQAVDATQTWLNVDMLGRIVRIPNVIVVIAGQSVPAPGMWANRSQTIRLERIGDRHVHEIAERIGLHASERDINAFCAGEEVTLNLTTRLVKWYVEERRYGR